MRLKLSLILPAAALLAASLASSTAFASPISGSFTFSSNGGTYVGAGTTAANATGLDFGTGSTGNGYGTNGTASIANTSGSFTGLTAASIADIILGATTANPYTSNPFIAFTGSNIVLNFSNAGFTRSPLGTSVTIAGIAMYSDGIAADANTGTFSLSVNSQSGDPSNYNFTLTGNAGAPVAVTPEPSSLALLGTGLVGAASMALRRRKLIA